MIIRIGMYRGMRGKALECLDSGKNGKLVSSWTNVAFTLWSFVGKLRSREGTIHWVGEMARRDYTFSSRGCMENRFI